MSRFKVGDVVEITEAVKNDKWFRRVSPARVEFLVGTRKKIVKVHTDDYELEDYFVYEENSIKLVQRHVSPIRLWLDDKLEVYSNEFEPSVEMGDLLQELDNLLKAEEV